ncbi:MAG: hypothetical protein OEY89_11075 [Gammaproteobacteria bacterium]|nr:hypothetical protein [Gammaproteobacteria bacterium]
MKLMLKLMLVLLVLVGASPFILPGKNGQPLFSFSDLKMPDFSSLFGSSKSKVVVIPEGGAANEEVNNKKNVTTVHKWLDDSGVWQFSDQNNSGGNSEMVKINPDSNVVQAMKLAKPEEEKTSTTSDNGEKAESDLSSIPLPTTIPMKDIPKLISQTKELKNTLEQRYQEQQTLLDSISTGKK